ncbi:MAG TPA: MbcA/ParS/Xre antitoxin family protein [Candidatus Margulisiibacteriota bacterium]|nr:MbcA/ParS/Xre antitoxin family protein [Candidatus Margulisiibacteriota bacterium]
MAHAQPIARVREGRSLGRQAPLAGLLAALGLPLRTVAEALAIPERTMHRLKNAPVVPAVIADKIARTHDVLVRAAEVLGSTRAAQQWLTRANPALAGKTPLSLLDTSLGWEQVKLVLGRIEHGVPA